MNANSPLVKDQAPSGSAALQVWSRPFNPRWGTALLIAAWLWCGPAGDVVQGADAPPHPERRLAAAPAGGEAVDVNPPSLLWPAARLDGGAYRVQLAQDPAFPPGRTIEAAGLAWAMFTPQRPLPPGRWWWRVGVGGPEQAEAAWGGPYEFVVPDSARRRQRAPASAWAARAAASGHPRVLASASQIARLRGQRSEPAARRLLRLAAAYLDRQPPPPEAGEPREQGDNAYQARTFARWASKAYAGRVTEPVAPLCMAWLLSGDPRFARAAVRHGLFVADLDPDGVTAWRVSDFADGRCLQAMALVFDSCYDELTPGQRDRLRRAIAARARPFYSRAANNLETRVFSAHIWQHILMQFAEAALATAGELPDADQWLAYVYELWVARFPLLGGDDGAWANGVNYFGTNFDTLLDLPELLGRYSGVDLMDHPWYRSAIYYQLYAWPPGSSSDGFGDGSEREGPPPASRGWFVDALARRFADPYGAWYAQRVLRDAGEAGHPPTAVVWRRLTGRLPDRDVDAKPPSDLPQARAFPVAGVVEMHTHLDDPRRNVMVAFRSSPFGAANHMHADQNSFNLLVGGERLLANSGYYIAYGDPHFQGWYKHSRGQNTVLIDGRGQTFGAAGYGRIVDFLDQGPITYCAGDASHAYGDAGLTRFVRHLALIRPSVLVIYDELEADHPAQWSWLVHSKARLTAEPRGLRLRAAVDGGRGQLDLWASEPAALSLSDQFDPPAVNWRKRTAGGKVIDYPRQWHATLAPRRKTPALRVLAVVQASPAADPRPLAEPQLCGEGEVRIGEWRVGVELDPRRPARLEVRDAGGRLRLAAPRPAR